MQKYPLADAYYVPLAKTPSTLRSYASMPFRPLGAALDLIAYATLCALAFALPWEMDTGPRWAVWLGSVAFAAAMLRMLALSETRWPSDLHYGMLAFALWSSLSILWTLDFHSTQARAVTYIQLVILAWVVWNIAINESRVLGLLQAYVLGTYMFAFGTISNVIAGHAFAQPEDVIDLNGDRYSMTGMNPNSTASLLAPSIPMALYLLARRRASPVMVLLCWLQLVLCITTILLSGSRGALLAAVPGFLMLPFVVGRIPGWQKVTGAIAASGTITCAAILVPANTWKRIFRLGTEIEAGTMTHRTDIWRVSMSLFRDHPLLGIGAGTHQMAVMNILGEAKVAHNTFISVLVETGVVGLVLLLGVLGIAFYMALRMPAVQRALWLLVLSAWMIDSVDTTKEYLKVTWFLLALIASHAYARTDRAGKPTTS
jgi:O-antigen ligase